MRAISVILSALILASDTPKMPVGWRSDGTGVYTKATPPTSWSEDRNVLWKTKLPGRSQGSPVLVGEHIFVVSDPAELLCINAADGKVLWRQSNDLHDVFGPDKAGEIKAAYTRLKNQRRDLEREYSKAKGDPDKQQEIRKQQENANRDYRDLMKQSPAPASFADGETTNSAATPTTDGKFVYAVFGNGIVGAYKATGERRWIKFLEMPTIGFGHSSSPLLVDCKLIIHLNDLFALDTATGAVAWRVALSARHASPVAARVGDQSVLISPAGAILRVADGQVLLKDNALSSSECSPLLHDGVVYAIPGSARVSKLIAASDGGVKLQKLWERRTAGGRRTPSPVLYNDLLYCITTDGILEVLDAANGELVYQRRLDIGQLYSSATAAGEYVYLSSTKGTTIVLSPGREYKEVARNKLEGFGSCPIFSGQRMYVRTRQYLYCIGQ